MKSTVLNETKKLNYSVREAFKALRTNFLFCGDDIKTVLITSCVKNEGKSTISLELSKSLAISEKKVLLVDADLRKSVFATKYTQNANEILGLSEYLSGQATLDDIFYATQNENLHMIFAGAVPPNPVELLGSAKFQALLADAREKYDYVIVDAAPLGAVIDASAISAFVDGAILVITANEISYRFAQDVKLQLEKSNCRVLGAILNRIPMRNGSYYNNYYKKYYGRYKKYGYGGKYGRYGKYSKYGHYYGYGQYGGYGYGEEDKTDTSNEKSSKKKNKK
ncbi:MAG: CpsD/CapB family tyrosine-protein kinase [Clostridia bacterium]|nr:CpsD/CapB family tyrosine-protein kinase [Clostridia bacterium]